MTQITQNNLKTIFLFLSCIYFLTTNAQTVSTFVGSTQGFADGTGITTQFWNPSAIALDTNGTIYVADTNNNCIRKITNTGVVTTFAGSTQGFADGTGTSAKFYSPKGLAVDAAGNVFVADTNNHRIRKITSTGDVSTFAGTTNGYADGIGNVAKFNFPQGVAVNASGTVFIADTGNIRIRKITITGDVTTFAGSSTAGTADGTGTAAKFDSPQGLAVDSFGNIFVADTYNNSIRKITPTGEVTTLAGGTGQFYYPHSVAVDANGTVFVADTNYSRIRKITNTGVVTTLAGSTDGFADGIGTESKFYIPSGMAIDVDGTIFVADSGNNRIRKITNSLSTPNFQLENQVSLYPNPASTLINIELVDITATRVTILDMNGKILQSENIFDNKTTINISKLVSGIYFLQITTDKGKVSKKIVKQ